VWSPPRQLEFGRGGDGISPGARFPAQYLHVMSGSQFMHTLSIGDL